VPAPQPGWPFDGLMLLCFGAKSNFQRGLIRAKIHAHYLTSQFVSSATGIYLQKKLRETIQTENWLQTLQSKIFCIVNTIPKFRYFVIMT